MERRAHKATEEAGQRTQQAATLSHDVSHTAEIKTEKPHRLCSLPAKLLFLTLLFVMLAEVLIFIPSVGREQETFFRDRMASAHLAVLALEASPTGMVNEDLLMQLLTHAEAQIIGLKTPEGANRALMAGDFDPSQAPVDRQIDLRDASVWRLMGSALETLSRPLDGLYLRVVGFSPKDPDYRVEMVLEEERLILHLRDFAKRVLALSIFISVLVGLLIYLSLLWLFVRPVKRLSSSILQFAQNPEIARVSQNHHEHRQDELGIAQRHLSYMQETVRRAFRERARLAALGTAVTKINHDLRNLLSTSLLLSDSLEASHDPQVKKVAPRLIQEIERAAELCTASLRFAKETPSEVERETFNAQTFLDSLCGKLAFRPDCQMPFSVSMPQNLVFKADRNQLERLFTNLLVNAGQAGASQVSIEFNQSDDQQTNAKPETSFISIEDNAGGLPLVAQHNLFTPFSGTTKKDGTGLGLSIAKDIAQAHGGTLTLAQTSDLGTCFHLNLGPASFALT